MEKLAEALISVPSSPDLSDGELSKQCNNLLETVLYKTPAATLASGNDLLAVLNPQLHTLSCTFILYSPPLSQSILEVHPRDIRLYGLLMPVKLCEV